MKGATKGGIIGAILFIAFFVFMSYRNSDVSLFKNVVNSFFILNVLIVINYALVLAFIFIGILVGWWLIDRKKP